MTPLNQNHNIFQDLHIMEWLKKHLVFEQFILDRLIYFSNLRKILFCNPIFMFIDIHDDYLGSGFPNSSIS